MTNQQLPNLPFSAYKGGRFEHLLTEPFTKEIWEFLTDHENIRQMISAIDEGKPAIWPLLDEIESRFGNFIASESFPDDDVEIMINNMIKQIMEYAGYEHVACGMLRHGRYIKLSGVYQKLGQHNA